jgi:hypothetical protein
MSVTPTVFVEGSFAPNAQTTIYTASGIAALIDKFTATNTDAAAHTISINLVPFSGAVGASNLAVSAKTLLPGETYTFPEITAHVLNSGDFISVIASAANTITIRVSGRMVT